jgi:hypothetical protein
MMTKKGAAEVHVGRYQDDSDSRMPTSRPPRNVMGKEEKPPTRAAARAGTTTKDPTEGLRPVNGPIRIPASPASAPPMVQLMAMILEGDHPSADDAIEFSALAVVAMPKRVYR